MIIRHGITILVVSCDKYSDLWGPFFSIFWKMWPDCPYPVYLGSNEKTYSDSRVIPIPIGKDTSWTSGVRRMIDCLDAQYVILFLEDFIITQPVVTAEIERLARIAQARGLGCLRLAAGLPLAFPPSRPTLDFGDLGVIEPGELYRVTAQVAIWRVETLRKLLIPGLSAWKFEEIGTQLSEKIPDIFWGAYQPKITYDQAVEKGKWKPESLAFCQNVGVKIDISSRAVFTHDELDRHYLQVELSSQYYDVKRKAILDFRRGLRRDGMRCVSLYLSKKPFSIQMWLIGFMGLIGAGPIIWLQEQYLKWKIAMARLGRA